jgi:hypothetical protein
MYNGKVETEPIAVLTRIAPTFFRFGSFEICNPGDAFPGSRGGREPIVALRKFCAQHFFPREWAQAQAELKRVHDASMLATADVTIAELATPTSAGSSSHCALASAHRSTADAAKSWESGMAAVIALRTRR